MVSFHEIDPQFDPDRRSGDAYTGRHFRSNCGQFNAWLTLAGQSHGAVTIENCVTGETLQRCGGLESARVNAERMLMKQRSNNASEA